MSSSAKTTARKSVRFDSVVEEAGQPVQVTLWTKPEEDRDFMRAVKEKRVVTVVQHNVGTKKDYGLVGFYAQERATYLLFPKRIDQADETKVVGIKYEWLATAEPKGGIYRPPKPRAPGIPLREKAKLQALAKLERPQSPPPKAKVSEPKTEPAKPEPPPPPKLFKFQSKVELKATQTATIEVEATSAKEAAKLLKARAKELRIDTGQAKATRKVGKPQKTGG
jgi:hypothetical protein